MMRTLLMIVGLISCMGCVPTPLPPEPGETAMDSTGVFVLCEGLWRQDNSTLAMIGDAGNIVSDVASDLNAPLRLGDTGSDVHVRGDSVYVVVNGSRTIEVFHRRTGRWQARLRFTDNREPYKIAFANDSVAYCTFLNDNTIAEFDPRTLVIRVARAEVGPAPEGIAVIGNHVYVAISGLGDLRSSEQGAGTVVVLDRVELRAIDTIKNLPNAMSVAADKDRGIVWLCYRNLRSRPDSLGGVIALDAATRKPLRSWRFASPRGITVDNLSGICYILHEDGVDELSPRISKPLRIITHSSRAPNDIWYGIGVSPRRQKLYICNARSYVTNGEVLVYRTNGELLNRYDVGVNPGGVASSE
jgi:DNA-binding beta-propeller fold protein YncE